MVARRGTGGDEAVAEHVAPPRVGLGVPRRGRLAPVVLARVAAVMVGYHLRVLVAASSYRQGHTGAGPVDLSIRRSPIERFWLC